MHQLLVDRILDRHGDHFGPFLVGNKNGKDLYAVRNVLPLLVTNEHGKEYEEKQLVELVFFAEKDDKGDISRGIGTYEAAGMILADGRCFRGEFDLENMFVDLGRVATSEVEKPISYYKSAKTGPSSVEFVVRNVRLEQLSLFGAPVDKGSGLDVDVMRIETAPPMPQTEQLLPPVLQDPPQNTKVQEDFFEESLSPEDAAILASMSDQEQEELGNALLGFLTALNGEADEPDEILAVVVESSEADEVLESVDCIFDEQDASEAACC